MVKSKNWYHLFGFSPSCTFFPHMVKAIVYLISIDQYNSKGVIMLLCFHRIPQEYRLKPGAMEWMEIDGRGDMGAIQGYMKQVRTKYVNLI